MERTRLYQRGKLFLALLGFLWLTPQITAYTVLRQHWVLARVDRALRGNLAEPYGMGITFSGLRPGPGVGIELVNLRLRDLRRPGRPAVATLPRAQVKLSIFRLLLHPGHPESAVAEVRVERPTFVLSQDEDGSWIWARFLTDTTRHNYLRPVVRLHGAKVIFTGQPLVKPIGDLTLSNATFDLRAYPRVHCSAAVSTALDRGLRLTVTGQYDLERASGLAQIRWQGAAPATWQAAGWLPADWFVVERGRLDGEAQVELGPVLSLRYGSARLTGGTIAPRQAGWPRLTVQGRAELRYNTLVLTDVLLATGRSAAEGNLRLALGRADAPISGIAHLTRLDLGELAQVLPLPDGITLRGQVQGRFSVAGRRSQPVLRGDLTLSGGALSRPSWPPVEKISVRGRLAAHTLLMDSLHAETAGADVSGHGSLRLLPAPYLDLFLEAREASIGELLDALGAPGWRGRADLQGRISAAPGRWTIRSTLGWAGVSLLGQGFPAGNARLDCENAGGKTGFSADGRVGAGRLRLSGGVIGDEWRGQARLEHLPLAPLAPFLPAALHDLGGEATADLTWRGLPRTPAVEAVVTIERPRVAGREADSIQGAVTVRGSEVSIESARIDLGEATASLRGRFDWQQGDLAMNLALHRMPLSTVLPHAAGRAEGQLDLAGQWPRAVRGNGRAHLVDLFWQGVALGTAEVEVGFDRDQVSITRAHVESADGALDLAGTVPLTTAGELALSVTSPGWETQAFSSLLPGQARPRGRLAGRGRITGSSSSPVVQARLQSGPGEAYGVAWQNATADLRWQQKRLAVEQAVIVTAGAEIAVTGSVGATGWDLAVYTARADLAAVLESLPCELPLPAGGISGFAVAQGKVTGPLDKPVVHGALDVDRLALGGFACDRLAGRFSLDGAVLSVPELEARAGDRRYAAAGRIDLSSRDAEFETEVTRGDLAGLLSLAGVRLPWKVSGTVTGRARIGGRLDRPVFQSTIRLEQGAVDGFAVAGELNLASDGETVTLDALRLTHGTGVLTASGRLAATEFVLDAEGRNLPLADLAGLAGYREDVRGQAGFRVVLNRTAHAMGGRFQLEAGPGASLARVPLERAIVSGTIADRQILLERAELVSAGHELTAAGRLPLPADLGSLEPLLRGIPRGRGDLDLESTASSLPLALFNPACGDAVTFAGGSLDMAAKLAGTWAKPVMDGTISVNGASGRTSLLPDAFSGLVARGRLTGRDLVVTEAGVRLGAGSASLSGTISLSPAGPLYDLKVKARNVAYRDPSFFEGRADADLMVREGPMPTISGRLVLNGATVTVGPPGPLPPPIGLDIHLVAEPEVRFFIPGVADVSVRGELQLGGTMRAPTLSGVVGIPRGTVSLYGERFELTNGMGSFAPERGYLPYVELQGLKVIRGVKVFLTARGNITESGLSIGYRSDPPLSQQEILDLLHRTSVPGGGDTAPDVGPATFFAGGFELMLDTVFGQLSDDFRRLINVDRLQLGLDDQSGALRFELGKFVQDDLYVSYRAQFGEFAPRTWSFDYRLGPFLVLSGTFGNIADPKWTLAYGIRF